MKFLAVQVGRSQHKNLKRIAARVKHWVCGCVCALVFVCVCVPAMCPLQCDHNQSSVEGRSTTGLDKETQAERERGREKVGRKNMVWFVECASHPSVGLPPLASFFLPSPSFLLDHSDVILRPPQAQLHSEPALPPSLSFSPKSLSLLSLHFQRHARRGDARERRALRHNRGLFLPWKRGGGLLPHISFCRPLYCTVL